MPRTAVQKARKLIERDKVDFLLGNVNSALALAMANVSNEKGVFHIVPGGHTDCGHRHATAIGTCSASATRRGWKPMRSPSSLIKNYGKKWYFITPDYAFGHTLQAGFEASLKAAGGTKVGADFTPLGTTDFSAIPDQGAGANPDVIILLLAGDDMINCAQAGGAVRPRQELHIAGAQQELEVLEGLPPEARIGTWVFEWYWKQPGVPHVEEFVADIRKKTAARCRRRAPGSAMPRPGAARSPPTRRSRSMP